MSTSGNIIKHAFDALRPDRSHILANLHQRRHRHRSRKKLLNYSKDAFLLLAGTVSAGFGVKGFLLPAGFIDGGVTGISLLIHHSVAIPLALLIFSLNLPFLLLSRRQFSSIFTIKSIVSTLVLAIIIAYLPFPVMTHDKTLVSVFGGFFVGVGLGLSIRGGGIIDGTEVLAVYMSRRFSFSVGDTVLVFNILLFSLAATFLNVETALYSILTYLSTSKTIDFVIEGIEEYMGVTIISVKSQQIRNVIKDKLGRGLTLYSGKKGYGKTGESNQTIDIIFTVITRLEINRLTTEVEHIDPNAFIFMHNIKDTRGGMVKKRPLK